MPFWTSSEGSTGIPTALKVLDAEVGTRKQRPWSSPWRGNLYQERSPSRTSQLHPATNKGAGSPPPPASSSSVHPLPQGHRRVYSPPARSSCPSLAPAAHCNHQLQETLAERRAAEPARPCKPQLPGPSVLASRGAASPPVTSDALRQRCHRGALAKEKPHAKQVLQLAALLWVGL